MFISILYIGTLNKHSTGGGGDVINKRNQKLLVSVSSGNIEYIEPEWRSLSGKLSLGISNNIISLIDLKLRSGKFTHVFVAQSLMGRVARYVKRKFPTIQIITFFHNIEIDYGRAYLREKGLRALPFYCLARFWEKRSVNYSSKCITLNRHDSERLLNKYGRVSSLELPTSFDDSYDNSLSEVSPFPTRIDYLFVGVGFYANIQGIQWFIDNVLPCVDGHLYIVGNGMDTVHFNNLNDRIHVYGFQEELGMFYHFAKMVVSPIFIGAGMKTKTAEALMWGKMIIGTADAFIGYEYHSDCMREANTLEEFVQAIKAHFDETKAFEAARDLFLKNHCSENLMENLQRILCS